MVKSSLMSSTALLSEEDRALLNETSAPDLPTEMKNLIVHVQANSPELVAGDAKEFSVALSPGTGSCRAMASASSSRARSATSFWSSPATGSFVEYKPARGGWVKDHLEKPSNASWFERDDSPDGKDGLYLVDIDGNPGNRVEETIYAHELISAERWQSALHRDAGVPVDGNRRRARI